MRKSDYSSMCYITKNEDGLRQVEMEYKRTFLQRLFLRPAQKEVWVGSTVWYNKFKEERASRDKTYEIHNVIRWCEAEIARLERDPDYIAGDSTYRGR